MHSLFFRQQFTFKVDANRLDNILTYIADQNINITASIIALNVTCDDYYDVLLVLGTPESTTSDMEWNLILEAYLQCHHIEFCKLPVIEVLIATIVNPQLAEQLFNVLSRSVNLYRMYEDEGGNIFIAAAPILQAAAIIREMIGCDE